MMPAVELLGWAGSALVVVSLTQRDLRRLRQVNLAAALMLGVFNVIIGLGSMIALNVVLSTVNAYHLIGDARSSRNRVRERSLAFKH
jgi:hypothetical protein